MLSAYTIDVVRAQAHSLARKIRCQMMQHCGKPRGPHIIVNVGATRPEKMVEKCRVHFTPTKIGMRSSTYILRGAR